MIGAEMPTISNHLKILRNVGYIDTEKSGTQVYHFLVRDCVKAMLNSLNNLEKEHQLIMPQTRKSNPMNSGEEA